MEVKFLLIFALIASISASNYYSKDTDYAAKTLSQSSRGVSNRIVGGNQASRNQFPHQVGLDVQLSVEEDSWCGGSLISENYVLTAAHCVNQFLYITVLLGAYDTSLHTEEGRVIQLIYPDSVKVHEKFNISSLQNDIALIKLSEPVNENTNISPIRLPSRAQVSSTFASVIATISGWGKTSDSNTIFPDILRYVDVSIQSNAACKTLYSSRIQDTNICTAGSGGKGPCNGDSGGPLFIVDSDNIRTQVGVVSFGSGFGCQLNWPTVYTRTTSFLDWIQSNSDVIIREN